MKRWAVGRTVVHSVAHGAYLPCRAAIAKGR